MEARKEITIYRFAAFEPELSLVNPHTGYFVGAAGHLF
jgi:hypothetical protein